MFGANVIRQLAFSENYPKAQSVSNWGALGSQPKSWTVKKANRKNIDSFEIWCWRRACWVPWTAGKINKWVPEQIKPETSLEAKNNKT